MKISSSLKNIRGIIPIIEFITLLSKDSKYDIILSVL